MTHPILQDLNRRYATKKYDASKRISAEDMEVIKEALRISASSVNSQPWRFIIIESDAAKQRLHDSFADKFPTNQIHAKEASHVILFAHNPQFTREDYQQVIEAEMRSGRLSAEMRETRFNIGMFFVDLNTDETGYNGEWTKAQTYLALGNMLHVVARLGLDSTPLEGINTEMIAKEFEQELDGYMCDVALAIGYHLDSEDYNYDLPKSRLDMDQVVTVL